MNDITNFFNPAVRFIEREIDCIDELVTILKASDLTDMLQRISSARKKVMVLNRLLSNKPELMKLISHRMKSQTNELLLYMEDIYDSAITLKNDIQQYDGALARCHSHYLAQISIEITQASNRGNELTTKLTILASVLVPLNIITGLWGMNVNVPGQYEGNLNWFMGIVCSMLLLSIVVSYIIWKLQKSASAI